MVMRPWTLRPSVFDCLTISGQYGSPLCSSGVTTLTSARRPGEVGLTFTSGIASRVPLFRRREIDFLARGEPHVGLFPVAAAALDAAEAARLALDVGHGHRVDLGLEHQLDRRLDLRLGRVVGDTEHVLAILVGNEGALLRHDRREHDGHQALGAVFPRRRHFSISSSFASAAFVRSTLGKRTSATGLAWRTLITSTFGRLRDESSRFWSISSVMTSTPSKPIDLTFCASSLVFGCSTRKSSTTRMRSSRASCDRIEHSPARYILRFTLCEKFSSGEFGKILPPPRHSGLEVMPARARPVPFCRHGFLVEGLTAPRSFCARVPRRAFAWNATTIWCTSAWLKSRANSASGALKVPAAPLSFSILSSMARSSSALLRVGLRCRRGRLGGLGGLRRGFRGRRLGGLDHNRLGNLDRRPHDHVAPARTGHRALDEQELPLGIDADDLQIQNRAAHVAEVAGHALAGKYSRRALVLAGRAGLVMRDRVAVGGAVGREMVTLDHAGKTLADGDALHVHLLPDLEDLDADLAADLQVGEVLGPGAEFAQRVAGFDTRLGEMPGEGFADSAGAALAERHLDGCITILLGALDLGDAVVGDVQHRHRLRDSVVGEDPRHADLAADQSYRHF